MNQSLERDVSVESFTNQKSKNLQNSSNNNNSELNMIKTIILQANINWTKKIIFKPFLKRCIWKMTLFNFK